MASTPPVATLLTASRCRRLWQLRGRRRATASSPSDASSDASRGGMSSATMSRWPRRHARYTTMQILPTTNTARHARGEEEREQHAVVQRLHRTSMERRADCGERARWHTEMSADRASVVLFVLLVAVWNTHRSLPRHASACTDLSHSREQKKDVQKTHNTRHIHRIHESQTRRCVCVCSPDLPAFPWQRPWLAPMSCTRTSRGHFPTSET